MICVTKGRQRGAKGEKHGMSKLDYNKVFDIKILNRFGWRRKQLSEKFNVSIGCINGIVLGINWKHVEVPI